MAGAHQIELFANRKEEGSRGMQAVTQPWPPLAVCHATPDRPSVQEQPALPTHHSHDNTFGLTLHGNVLPCTKTKVQGIHTWAKHRPKPAHVQKSAPTWGGNHPQGWTGREVSRKRGAAASSAGAAAKQAALQCLLSPQGLQS
jgi:hypothetical protein